LLIGGEIHLNDRLDLMFFRRVQLREARAQDVRLPVFGVAAHGFLLGPVFDEPDLEAVAAGIADQNDFEDGILRLQVEFVVE